MLPNHPRRSRTQVRSRARRRRSRSALILGAILLGAGLFLLSGRADGLARTLDGYWHTAGSAAPAPAVDDRRPDEGGDRPSLPGGPPAAAPQPAPAAQPVPAPQPQPRPAPPPPPPTTPAPTAPPPMTTVSRPAPQPQPVSQPDYTKLQADLAAILSDYGPRSSVWFEDLLTGQRISLGADQRFHPASTIKVPLVVALFEGAQQGKWSLDEQWAISSDDWEDGAGELQNVPAGTRFTLRDLARRAIEQSDNIAANALLRKVGFDPVKASMRQAGAALASGSLTSLTAADLGAVLDSLARRWSAAPKTWQPLMDWLSHTTFNEWLPAPLPAAYTVYHKWGSYGSADHDAGLVTGPGVRYVLVVYTDGTKDGGALIQAVSARVARTYPASRVN